MDSFNNGGSNYLIEDAELQDVDVYSYNMIQAEQNNYLPEHEYVSFRIKLQIKCN